jgi:hypothetical protein
MTLAHKSRRAGPAYDGLKGLKRFDCPYYLGWGSAFAHYGLLEEIPTQVLIAIPARRYPTNWGPWSVRFITLPKHKFFGSCEASFAGTTASVATIEKAVLDSLDRPRLLKPDDPSATPRMLAAAWRSGQLDAAELVEAALRYQVDSLTRRLGYFMELFGIPGADTLHSYLPTVRGIAMMPGWKMATAPRRDTRWGLALDDTFIERITAP